MTHSKINKVGLGKMFFPSGCPYCNSDVLFRKFSEVFDGGDPDDTIYICSNTDCMAYTLGHRDTKGGAVKDYPQGVIANKQLRDAHDLLRSKFSPLWMDNQIKFIYRDFIVKYIDENEEECVGIADGFSSEGTYKIYNEDKSVALEVPALRVSKVNTRTKAYFWLALKMDMTYQDCKIPMLNLEDTSRAIGIIDEATQQLNI
jgi:hypothetical protein